MTKVNLNKELVAARVWLVQTNSTTMPYKIISEANGFLIKWWGDATTSELIEMQEQGHAYPDFDRLRYSIHDLRDCDHFAFNPNEIEYSAAIDGAAFKTNKEIKIAVVGDNPEMLEVVSAYMSAGLSHYPLRSFFHIEDARAWVDNIDA